MTRTKKYEVVITGMDPSGHGTAEVDGLTLMIPGGVPGDRVSAETVHVSHHRNTGWCRLVAVKRRGDTFVEPPCPHAWPVNGRCGGCPLMHVGRAAQSDLKRALVTQALSKHDIDVAVTWHPSPKQTGYRNRGQFVVSATGGKVVLGAYAPRSHDVVSMAGCRVVRRPMAQVAGQIAAAMTARRIPVYPNGGGVRYVTIRAAENGACLVDLVVGSEGPYLTGLGQALLKVNRVIGVSVSVNAEAGNAIRVGPSTLLAGTPHIIEPVGGLSLKLSAASFSQLNRDVMAEMYAEAARLVPEGVSVVWDLYAGVGGLGLTVASSRPRTALYAADVVDSAAPLALDNGKRAGVDVHYEVIDLQNAFPETWPTPDVVLLNPPRRGLDRIVLDRTVERRPEVIVYMSCNPESFAEDADVFLSNGYTLGGVSAYDMLPGTAHVEVIAAFIREK